MTKRGRSNSGDYNEKKPSARTPRDESPPPTPIDWNTYTPDEIPLVASMPTSQGETPNEFPAEKEDNKSKRVRTNEADSLQINYDNIQNSNLLNADISDDYFSNWSDPDSKQNSVVSDDDFISQALDVINDESPIFEGFADQIDSQNQISRDDESFVSRVSDSSNKERE